MTPKNVQMPNPNPKYKPPGTPTGGRGGKAMKMTLNEEIEFLRNGKWYDKIGETLLCDEYLNLGWAIRDVLDTLESLRMLQPKVETNADRIRAMSDEELARMIACCDTCTDICLNEYEKGRIIERCNGNCLDSVLKWLQQPAEEEKL